MSPQLRPTEIDDAAFVALLNRLIAGVADRDKPHELWVIHVDNWFDYKWLRFPSGPFDIRPVDLHSMTSYDAARAPFYKRKLRFPPFTPKRVLAQWSFERGENGYTEVATRMLPHSTAKKERVNNPIVQGFSGTASYFWYSGNTLSNGKGSVMVYNVVNDAVAAWFATFSREQRWKLSITKGAKREDVAALLDSQ